MSNNKVTFSKHAINDRMDRLLGIAMTIGWGDIICNYYDPERLSYSCLTSTGIMLIKDKSKVKLITAYVASVDEAQAVWSKMGYGRLPHGLAKTIYNNYKKYGNC